MKSDSSPPSARHLEYLDFELEISPGSGREYPVAVIRSPAGEARATMRFPFDELALENRLQALQIALLRSGGPRRRMPSQEERAVQDFGQALFDALLTGEVRSRYDVSQERAWQEGKGLRLKLRIQSPELAALPWEFLYDPRQAEYTCLSRNTPVVRYLELPQPIQPLSVTPPLRILGMVASPRDLELLDVKREKQRVERAVRDPQANGLVDLAWLEGQTWRDLQRAMRGGPWHVFHFIGHGGFDRNKEEGFIALANEDGQTHRLHATELGRLLADHRSLRLALLNSCEGARGSEWDIFSSTAAILVRRGIPAVLAMQYEITDQAAIEFARAFYEALADGLPVDAAVAEARKAVSLAVTNTVEWGTPVLYMRSPDGVLFSIQRQQEVSGKEQEEAERKAREEATRLEQERQEREAREKAAKEEAERKVREKAAQEQIARQIADLSSQLSQAESLSDWDTVIELGERMLKLDAGHQPTCSKTAAAYKSRGVSYGKKGDYDRAIADYNRAIELNPNKADYYRQRGVSYGKKGDYDRAIAAFNRAIELNPNKADYYRQRGAICRNKGDYDRAIADYNCAIELDPNKADYYWERGVSYSNKGDYDRAFADYNQAIKLKPDYAAAYNSRGNAYYYKGDYDGAIADYNQAIKLKPDYAAAYNNRGGAYYNKGDYDRAIADYNRAIELDPNKADYYFERGKSYHEKGSYDRAIADKTRAIELDPNKAAYYFERGKSYHNKGDYDRAIADKTRAIELDPNKADYYFERGKSYHNKGDYDRAIADKTRAIELDPNKADYYYSRGISYHNKGDYDRAIADKTRAIELDPRNGKYYYSRGLTHKQSGNREAARRDFQRAAELGHADAKTELAKL